MAQADAIRQAHGLRVSVDKGERQGADLCVGILLRPLAPYGESGRRDHPGWASVGLA